jgi:hypothetical protein
LLRQPFSYRVIDQGKWNDCKSRCANRLEYQTIIETYQDKLQLEGFGLISIEL